MDSSVIGALSADRIFGEEISLGEDLRLMSIIASMIARAVRLRQCQQEEYDKLLEENSRLQEALRKKFQPANIVGHSKAIQSF